MMSLPLNIAKRNPTENGMIRRMDREREMAKVGANGIGKAFATRPEPDWKLLVALRIGGAYA